MSEQGKGNLQVYGAGIGAFVLVLAVGGAALAAYSKFMAAAPAAPAAPPIDISAHRAHGAPSAARDSREKRGESPAPMIGDMSEPGEGSDLEDALSAAPAGSRAARPVASGGPVAAKAAAAPAAPGLQRVESLRAEGASTTASAEAPPVAAKGDGAKKGQDGAVEPAPESAVASKGAALASTVQYGVTDRSALMGRAAGPVYNLKGATLKGSRAARMKSADDAAAKIEEARESARKVPLTPEEQSLLDAQLKTAGETLAPASAQ